MYICKVVPLYAMEALGGTSAQDVCVCMYVCVFVYMCVCVCAYVYVYVYVCMYVCMCYVCMHRIDYMRVGPMYVSMLSKGEWGKCFIRGKSVHPNYFLTYYVWCPCARLQKCPVVDRTVVLVLTSPFKLLDFFLYWNLGYFPPQILVANSFRPSNLKDPS
jgi:hypothetical protein